MSGKEQSLGIPPLKPEFATEPLLSITGCFGEAGVERDGCWLVSVTGCTASGPRQSEMIACGKRAS